VARRPVLENAVMDVVWESEDWLTTAEVRGRLNRAVAATTVGTVLARLHKKGRVQRREQGRSIEYRAAESREEFVASRMEDALDISRDRPVALLEFVDRLSPEDRSRLAKLLRR